MLQNIGTLDGIIRIALGIAIGLLGIIFRSWLGLLAVVPLLTAGLGSCPLYLPFGISTRKVARTSAE